MTKKSILVVSAHPDDEVLGCGGTLSKDIRKGAEVYSLILSGGVNARFDKSGDEKAKSKIKQLKKYIYDAAGIIGIKKIFTFDFPDNRFDTVALLDIVKVIEGIKKQVRPETVFTHFRNDINIDHKITYNAVLAACRPLENETVKQIYSFEVLSSTEWSSQEDSFCPDVFIDIAKTIDKKIKALQSYKSEIRKWPHPRSIEGIKVLARKRGCEAGLEFAEAFKLVRKIQR